MYDEKNTGTNLPGRDQDLGDRRRGVQVPVHRQGWRQRQQELPVPGDEGAAQRGDAAAVGVREDAGARHLGLPAVPPRRGDRRHLGRVRRRDRQARIDEVPRHASDGGLRARVTGSATSNSRPKLAGARPDHRDRRPVRRQVLLPRRARDPAPTPRSELPRRRWPCRARPTARRSARSPARACSSNNSNTTRPASSPRPRTQISTTPTSCTSISTVRWPRSSPSSSKYPVRTRVMLTGPIVVGRDIAHAKIKERLDAGEADAAVPAGPLHLLRRPGQDARGLRIRVRSGRPRRVGWTRTSSSSRPPAVR